MKERSDFILIRLIKVRKTFPFLGVALECENWEDCQDFLSRKRAQNEQLIALDLLKGKYISNPSFSDSPIFCSLTKKFNYFLIKIAFEEFLFAQIGFYKDKSVALKDWGRIKSLSEIAYCPPRLLFVLLEGKSGKLLCFTIFQAKKNSKTLHLPLFSPIERVEERIWL
mgnify:CR=1 FL=1